MLSVSWQYFFRPEFIHSYSGCLRARIALVYNESLKSLQLSWIDFFLRCLIRQKEVLERKIKQERIMAPLAPLSEKILAIIREHGRVTVREAVKLTGANRNTVKDHLKQLTRNNHIVRRGRGKGTWYEKT